MVWWYRYGLGDVEVWCACAMCVSGVSGVGGSMCEICVIFG